MVEGLTLLFAFLAVAVGVVYGEITRRGQRRQQESQRKQEELAQEQLSLAHAQAEMRPILEVSEVRLLEVEEIEELQEEVTIIEKRRRELEKESADELAREAQAEAVRQERKMFPSIPSWSDLAQPTPPILPTPYAREDPYEGSLPNKVVQIELVNRGRTAAYEVTGWVLFDADYIEPLDYFLDGYANEGGFESGFFRVEVGGGEESTLLPTANDSLIFRIAVRTLSAGETYIEYEFASRAGTEPTERWNLEIPAS